MAANTRQEAELRARRLCDSVLDQIVRGSRDSEEVARVLQLIKDKPNFMRELFPSKEAALAPARPTRGVRPLLREQQRFYFEVLGLKKDLRSLRIPEKVGGFNWLLVMAKELSLQSIWEKVQNRMKTNLAFDLSTVTSDRKLGQSDYAILVRDRIEADEELKNISANDIKSKGFNTLTLEERLLLELFYHWKTGNHLDISNWTLCAASRCVDSDGSVGVPCVYWDPIYDKLFVYWSHPSFADGNLRARQAVS